MPSAVQAVLSAEIARSAETVRLAGHAHLAAIVPLVVAPSEAVVPALARPLPAPPVVLSAVRPRAMAGHLAAAGAAFRLAAVAGPSAVGPSVGARLVGVVPRPAVLRGDFSAVAVVRSAAVVPQGAGDRLVGDRLEADGLHLAVGAAGRALPIRPFVVPIIAVQARPLWN